MTISNAYYEAVPVSRLTAARADVINADRQAIQSAFDQLPEPETLREGRGTYIVATGGSNTYVGAMTPPLVAYTEGLQLTVKIPTTNNGPATLNIDSLGARSIKRPDLVDPLAGQLVAGQLIVVVYDGTRFVQVGTSAVPQLQTSVIDATAGRGLILGGFGHGGLTPALNSSIDVTNNTINPGRYYVDDDDDVPAGITRGILIHDRRSSGGGETQVLIVEAETGEVYHVGDMLSRARTTGAWGAWRYGDVVDEGATSGGGTFRRHRNGRAIAEIEIDASGTNWTTANGLIFYVGAADLSWNYAAVGFYAAPAVMGRAKLGNSITSGLAIISESATAAVVRPWVNAPVDNTTPKSVYLRAEGRWRA